MPVAKLRASDTPDAMKSEEGNDSLDTFLKQTIGKQPFLSFSKTGDSPVQWIQLLHALDQQDLPGWPLLSPMKVQMQKCEKCSREFCSPINYRRHVRVHRRSLNVDKESHKNRDLLGAFWDKLSVDDAKEIVSFKDVNLEEVSGSSIIRSLASLIRKPGFCALPHIYVKAGSALLDIIQARPSRFPISSHELFSILDDASERTFLCAGTAESMQKYVFDGEAGKIGLDMKNVVACTSFLVEQKLVKAWLADKDAEALRCQKLLVEEEEAAQKRQAELLERKRQKKLRQKEHKAKDQSRVDLDASTDTSGSPSSTEAFSPPAQLDSDSLGLGISIYNAPSHARPVQFSNNEEDDEIEVQARFNSENSDLTAGHNAEPVNMQGNGRRHFVITRWQMPKSRVGGNGFNVGQNLQQVKLEPVQKHGPPRDTRSAPLNSSKIWTRKPKGENKGPSVSARLLTETTNQADEKCEMMIGSISVTVRNCAVLRQCNGLMESQDNCSISCSMEHAKPKKNCVQEKPANLDSVQSGTNRSSVKLWRRVNQHETRGQLVVDYDNQETREGKGDEEAVPREICSQSSIADGNDGDKKGNSHSLLTENVRQSDGFLFSSSVAEAFLAQRWKEAISADHVTLVLSPESEPEPESPGCPCGQNNCQEALQPSNFNQCSNLGYTVNHSANAGAIESSSVSRNTKAKLRPKPERGLKIKYIPKQKTVP